jgi:hypothetical protein
MTGRVRVWIAEDGEVYLNAHDVEVWVADLARRARLDDSPLAVLGAMGVETVAAQVADWQAEAARAEGIR